MKLTIPQSSIVLLIGPSGSGKSTFARQHFLPTEVLSSDFCRGLVADDENDQSATDDAYDVLHTILAKRLAAHRLTVIDATNVQASARKPLLALAREYHCISVAIVLNLPEKLCRERNRERPDRNFGSHVIRSQRQQLRHSLRGLKREGFRYVHTLSSPEQVEAVEIERQPLWNDLRHERGPFDIIGDLHGCLDELEQLLKLLGYEPGELAATDAAIRLHPRTYEHPGGRKAVFLGDLVDRGPRILETYQLVRNMVDAGHALCVPGNHDVKLARKLRGRRVQIRHGLEQSLAELDALDENQRRDVRSEVSDFLDGLISHYVLDGGKLVVAHAGMREDMQGRASSKVRSFAIYGDTTGETDEVGLPVRHNWAADYRGQAMVVYGHTPVPEAEWLNGTINIDTGCVFGGKLTAMRYPEKELVSVLAAQTYAEPVRPLVSPQAALSAQQEQDDMLDIEDVRGKRRVHTQLIPTVTIREENSTAALEVMSRFAINPKWLIYLPPTMSPCETSEQPGLLEHPTEALNYYARQGVSQVVCEEKHMGSRVVLIVCRDERVAQQRFGVPEGEAGVCYTRTGRPFFSDPTTEGALLEVVRSTLSETGFWGAFGTDWVCLDAELMPWSVKAQELLKQQYAAVGVAAQIGLAQTVDVLERASRRGLDVSQFMESNREKTKMATQYAQAYRRYCWPVTSVTDLRLAPFHILASEGAVYVDRGHLWHMEQIRQYLTGTGNPCLHMTNFRVVELGHEASISAGIQWWESLTEQGGEGMVVKPFGFVARGKRGLLQPAIKCRGREYLRIIYGLEYTAPANLERLRQRGLSRKRALAVREFALGIEALQRFVKREPLRRVHECVFGVLALESEPVDPRL